MLEKILPDKFFKVLSEKVNLKALNEIRLRADKPVCLNVSGKNCFLTENGVSNSPANALYASKIIIEDVIFRASECSIYSVNEQIKKGYIVCDNAIRIGIGGNLIEENGKIKTMSNFSSCNIRIPHVIKNCSLSSFSLLTDGDDVLNTLILSPPGCGKTTFLRDFVFQLSDKNVSKNVLLLDERGELDVGINSNFCDKICFASKKIAFENGLRSLAPDIIVTDEIGQIEDVEVLHFASSCGVKIMASVHADDLGSFANKKIFESLIKQKIFKRFVVLSKRNGPGTVEGVYDENFSRVNLSFRQRY